MRVVLGGPRWNGPHKTPDLREDAGCLPPQLERVGASGSNSCNNNHKSDSRKARNSEANPVGIDGSVNP